MFQHVAAIQIIQPYSAIYLFEMVIFHSFLYVSQSPGGGTGAVSPQVRSEGLSQERWTRQVENLPGPCVCGLGKLGI